MADPIDVWRRMDEASRRKDLSVGSAVLADDAVLEFPGREPIKGREAITAFIRAQQEAMPDSEQTLLAQAVSGQTILSEFSQSGTHTGPLARPDGTAIPPTGKRVTMKGVTVVEVEGDCVKSIRFYVDTMSVFSQLGLVRPTAPRA